jgi:Domain of unknown function (DUF4258)
MERVEVLTNNEALSRVRECLRANAIRLTYHARERMLERDFDLQDVYACLKSGQIFRAPEFDIKHGEWKYRIDGAGVDGSELILVVCFKQEQNTLVITVFPDE